MSRADLARVAAAAGNGGIAIGIGSTLPRVMSMPQLGAQRRGAGERATSDDERRSAGRITAACRRQRASMRHSRSFGIEVDDEVLPDLVFVRRAASAAVQCGLKKARRALSAAARIERIAHAALVDDRAPGRTVPSGSTDDPDLDDEVLGVARAGRHVPARHDLLRSDQVDLARRQLAAERRLGLRGRRRRRLTCGAAAAARRRLRRLLAASGSSAARRSRRVRLLLRRLVLECLHQLVEGRRVLASAAARHAACAAARASAWARAAAAAVGGALASAGLGGGGGGGGGRRLGDGSRLRLRAAPAAAAAAPRRQAAARRGCGGSRLRLRFRRRRRRPAAPAWPRAAA